MLTETVNNQAVFAAGHAEPGNDLPLLLSTTKAERVEGGYRFTGRTGQSRLKLPFRTSVQKASEW